MTRVHSIVTFSIAAAVSMAGVGAAQAELPVDPEFIIHTPDTTGMPGQQNVTFVRIGPEGRVWVSSRNLTIWTYGGIGILDVAADDWTTYSSRDTPVPVWTYEVDWDAAGNAWIAGEDRVLKFDGEWTVFDPSNSPLVGDRNWDIAVDPSDHIWVANDDISYVQGGLFEFDGTEWTHHDEPWMRTYFGASVPFAVFARSNGEIWATFEFMSGNAKYVGGTWIHQSGPAILQWAEAPDGTLYGTNGLGTYRYNDETSTWTTIGPYTSYVIEVDDDGVVWLGDDNIVRRYDGSWSVFAEGPSDVNSIQVRPDGHVWVGYDHSMRHYGPGGEGIRIYSSITTGIPDYIIDDIYRDRDGNLWFSTGMAGSARFDGEHYRNFSQYGHDEVWPFGSWTTAVNDVHHDSAGYLWLAGNAAARSFGLATWDVWTPDDSPMTAGVEQVCEDVNGTPWLGSAYGLFWFDGAQWHFQRIGSGYYDPVKAMEIDPSGVMWVLFQGRGLYKWDGVTWESVPGGHQGRDLAIAPNGDLWVATGVGLQHYDGSIWRLYTPSNSALAEVNVSSVAVREDGLVAAASEDIMSWPYDGGLAFFDGEEWTSFDYGESELPFYQTHSIEFDAHGNLWMAQVNFGAVEVIIEPDVPPVTGDLDGDGSVGFNDLIILLAAWDACDPPPAACIADIDGDGVVGFSDLITLLSAWGTS